MLQSGWQAEGDTEFRQRRLHQLDGLLEGPGAPGGKAEGEAEEEGGGGEDGGGLEPRTGGDGHRGPVVEALLALQFAEAGETAGQDSGEDEGGAHRSAAEVGPHVDVGPEGIEDVDAEVELGGPLGPRDHAAGKQTPGAPREHGVGAENAPQAAGGPHRNSFEEVHAGEAGAEAGQAVEHDKAPGAEQAFEKGNRAPRARSC